MAGALTYKKRCFSWHFDCIHHTVSPHSVTIALTLPFPGLYRTLRWGERIEPFSVGGGTAFPCVLLTVIGVCDFIVFVASSSRWQMIKRRTKPRFCCWALPPTLFLGTRRWSAWTKIARRESWDQWFSVMCRWWRLACLPVLRHQRNFACLCAPPPVAIMRWWCVSGF